MLQHHIHCLFSNSSETALPSCFNLVAFRTSNLDKKDVLSLVICLWCSSCKYICKFFGRIANETLAKVLRSELTFTRACLKKPGDLSISTSIVLG
jgi:hypothetical protein